MGLLFRFCGLYQGFGVRFINFFVNYVNDFFGC